MSDAAQEIKTVSVSEEEALDTRLIDGSIISTLIWFAMPLVGTNLMHSFSASYNAAWVGQVVGPNGLTAVVICNVLVWMMLMAAVMGVGNASNILIAQAYGGGRKAMMKTITGTSVVFVIIGTLILVSLGWVFAAQLIDLISTPPEARDQAIIFLRANCLAAIAIFPFVFITMMIRGTGDARTPFVFSAGWIGLGCVLSPVLLTGAFGAPHMGLAGMAYGLGLSGALSLLALIIWTYWKRHPLSLRGADLRYLRPDLSVFMLLLKRGSPMGLEGVLISGVYLALLAMVNAHGAETSSAYGAATQLWAYVQMPIGAIAASVSSMASQNIGAGRWDRVNELALKACLVCGGVTTVIVAVVYAFGETLLSLFLPDAGAPLTIALRINLLALWSWIPLAVTMVIFGIVRANGAMLPPTLIMVGTLWLARIPFADRMQTFLGVDAIWWSFPVGTFTCAALSFAYYRWGAWRSKSLMSD